MDLVKVNIFDADINYLGRIDAYTSLMYNRKWQTCDTLELHTARFDPVLLKDGNHFMLDNDMKRSGVIRYLERNETIKDDTIVKGVGLLYLLERVTVPPTTGGGYRVFNNEPAEDIIYALVKEQAIDNRPIAELRLGTSQHRGGKLTFQTRYKNLVDEIESLCKQSDLGVKMSLDPDAKTYLFEVVSGIDRSHDNTLGNEPYIFAKKFGRINRRDYTYSSIGAKTTAYVAGQGEGENREIIIIGDEYSGKDRREVFIDARDIEQGEQTSLADRGAAKLKEMAITDSIEFEASDVGTRDYRRLWDLGDTTSFFDKELDYMENNQIIEVQETYEKKGIKIEPTFGNPVKDIRDVVKATTEEIKAETRTTVGGDKTYTHIQTAPTLKWHIPHNLGKFPSCTITDSAGTIVMGDIRYIDKNTVEIVFSAQFAGKAFLN